MQSPLSPISVASNTSGVTFVQGDASAHPQLRPQPANLLVVIDPSVEDYQTLAAGVIDGASILILDSTQDGVEQITEYLVTQSKILSGAERSLSEAMPDKAIAPRTINPKSKIQSLHIVSHGSPGCLSLGSSQLNINTLEYYAPQLRQWRQALSEGDILLYGCRVAAEDAGQELVQKLHQLTKANLVASAHPTGSVALGGDWNLEIEIGQRQSPLAFQPQVLATYSSVFALSPGDLAVIGYNTDEPSASAAIAVPNFTLTIVALADIAAGETIKITDQGWRSGDSTFTSNTSADGTITWIPSGTVTAGTIIKFQVESNNTSGVSATVTTPGSSVASDITVSGWTLASSGNTNGDQILIYQGTAPSPTFIYGFNTERTLTSGSDGDWEGNTGFVPGSILESNLPTGLTNSNGANVATAHALTGSSLHNDNYVYTGPTSGSKDFLLTEIGKDSNWTGSETVVQDISIGGANFSSNFTVSTPNVAPTLSLPGAVVAYTENAAATEIDQTATVTDPDSADFDTGTLTVQFTAGGTANDRLTILNQGNNPGEIGLDGQMINYGGVRIGSFTGGIGTEPLVITFDDAAATLAAVEALLQNIAYANVSESPVAGNRTVQFVLDDGDGGVSSAVTQTINVAPSNDLPSLDNTVDLYDGSLNTLPQAQGWTYVDLSGLVNPTVSGGATNLDTTLSPAVVAGFSRADTVLDAAAGYTLSFTAQVLSESRTATANKNNDGKDDRAGFSLLVVSSDASKAIELGFWTDRVWAQADGVDQVDPSLEPDDAPASNFRTLFTQAEFVAFDTQTSPVNYDLTVQGDTYTLSANGTVILSGELRDYTAFSGPIDPYQTPNLLSFSDNTPSAQASFNLASVSVTTTVANAAVSYTEGPTAIAINPNLAINDLDNATLTGATVSISTGFTAGDQLNFTNQNGITGSYVAGTGVLTLTGPASLANYQTALQSITFSSTSDNPTATTTSRTVSFTVNDGAGNSSSLDQAIAITPVNDPPTGSITLSGVAQEDQTITANTSSIADPEGLGSFNYQWQQSSDGINWNNISGATSSTFVPDDGQVGQQLRVQLSYTDGQGTVETVTSATTPPISNINDLPNLTIINTAVTYDEDGANVPLSGITVSDDDNNATLTATLTLADPTAGSLTSSAGGTYTPATGEWNITDNEATVNAALAALEFDSAPNYDSNTSIAVSLSDGLSPAQTGGITVNVSVTDNDAPSLTISNTTVTYDEDGPNAPLSGITVSDPDDNATLTATLTLADPNAGSLTSAAGGTYTPATGEWTITGNEATVNAALAALEFDSAANYDLDTSVTVSLSDGLNPAQTNSIDLTIGATDNDAPSLTIANTTVTYNEDGANVPLTGISVSDPDTGATLTATLTLADPNAGSLISSAGGTYNPTTGEWSITGNEATVNAALAVLEFDSTANYDANTAIAVSLSDGVNPAQTGVVAVNVGATNNDNPVALNDTYSLDEDTTLNGDSVLTNDSDLPAGALNENNIPLTAQLVSAPTAAANFTLNSDGSFIYTPIQDFVGTDTFTYQAVDTLGGISNPATVTLTVENMLNEFIGSSQGDTLSGTSDGDSLNGFGGTDVINGLGGNDVLVGGPGRDRLAGGSGADTFVFESYLDRGDRISDFEVGSDLIDLSQIFASPTYSSATPFDDYIRLLQRGANTDVRINPIGDSGSTFRTLVTLENLDFATAGLDANSFIL